MNTTIKVLDTKQEVARYHVKTGDVLTIQAERNANYQLIDEATGVAPQNIIAKRENNNLVITLEDGDMSPDIVIENYYSNNGASTNLVIGQHENGKLYAYVPESGETNEAISILAQEVSAPQALGGEELPDAIFSPWWLSTLPLLGSLYAFKNKRLEIFGPGDINTEATPDQVNKQVDLNGTSHGLSEGTPVEITLTDQRGTSVKVQAIVGAGGRYEALNVDTQTLFDGPVTVVSHAKDQRGLPVQDQDIIHLDQRIPGDADNDSDALPEEAGKPIVTLIDGQDGRIHSPDLNDSAQAQAHITLPVESGYTVGDTIRITDPRGTVLLERPLTATDLSEGIRVSFTPQEEGRDNPIRVVVTDPQTNRSPVGIGSSMTDLRIPGDSNRDATANDSDANQGAPEVILQKGNRVLIKLPEANGYSVGDNLVVTLPNSAPQTITLTAQHLADGYTTEFTPNANGQQNIITAIVTDPQNNRSQEGVGSSVNRATPQVQIQTQQAHQANLNSPDLENEKGVAVIQVPESGGFRAGDTLIVTLPDGSSQNIILKTQDLTNGVRVEFTPIAEGRSNNVQAFVIDPLGNESATGSASAMSDLRMPGDENRDTVIDNTDFNSGAPTIVITTGKGGRITSPTLTEEGQAVAKITFSANHGYSVGDTLVVTLPEGNEQQIITLESHHFSEGVQVHFTPVAEGTLNTISAVVTDPQGNHSAAGIASSMTDLRMPGDENRDTVIDNTDFNNGAPQITFTTGKGGRITSPTLTEEGQAVAKITFSANHGYSVGDTLVVTLPEGNPQQVVALTNRHFSEGVEIRFNPVAEGLLNTISAVVTDPQGNHSEAGTASAMTDLRMPGDENRDTNANNQDANQGAPEVILQKGNRVLIKLPEANGYSVGDNLVVTLPNSAPQTITLTAQHLTDGYTTEFTPNANGQQNTIIAVVTDPQNNRSQEGVGSSVNRATPQVQIQTQLGNSANLNSPDLENEKGVAVIQVPESGGFRAGDTLVVTLPDGSSQNIILKTQDLTNGVRVEFTPVAEGEINTVQAFVIDPLGNESATGSASAMSDLRMPGDENRDTVIDNTDFNSGAPTIVITTGKGGRITSPTLTEEGQAVAKITFSANHGYSVGDTLVVTLPEGNEQQIITLESHHFSEGVQVHFTPVAEGTLNTISAVVTDPQGNRSANGSATAMTDLRMPGDENRDTVIDNTDFNKGAPEVAITTGKGGRITSPTLTEGEQAVAKITFSANHGYSVGDSLVVTLPEGNAQQTIPLESHHFNEGVLVRFTPVEEGKINTISAVVTDPQGNFSEAGTASAMTDLRMPGDENRDTTLNNTDFNSGAPEVMITTGKNGRITSPTLTENGQAVAKITFSANHGYSVGDSLVVTLPEGNAQQTIPLESHHFNEGVLVHFTPVEEGKINTISAVVTDPQGNFSEAGTASAMTDLRMPGDENRDTTLNNTDFNSGAPEVMITTGKNGRITSPTLTEGGEAVAKITFSANHGYSVGDTLTVTLPNDTFPLTFVLTEQNLEQGVTVNFMPRPEGQTNTVTAFVTDPQNNRSAVGSHSAISDIKMPGDSNLDSDISATDENLGAPEVVIVTGKGGRITSPTLENGKAVAIIGLVEELGYSVGDTLVITMPDGRTQQTITLSEDDFSEGVKVLFDPLSDGSENVIKAIVTDPQGNRSAEGSGSAVSDLIMPGDTNRDTETSHSDFHNGAPEVVIQQGNRSALINLSATNGYSVGDRLVVTLPDQSIQRITLEEKHLTEGVLITFEPLAEGQTNTVTAVVTDPQGNSSAEGSDSTVNRGTPVVRIETGANSAVNSPDLVNNKAIATILVPESNGFKEGDSLLVTLPEGNPPQTIQLTAEHLRSGVTIPFTPVAEGQFNVVRATVIDPLNNRSAEGSRRALSDLRMPGDTNRDTNANNLDFNRGAPEIEIRTGKAGRITAPTLENGQAVATIKLSANNGYSVGDKLTVTLPGNTQREFTLQENDLTQGIVIRFRPVAEGQTNTISAEVTDPQGNRSAIGSARAITDIRMPGDSNNDENATDRDTNRGAPEVTIATANANTRDINSTDLVNGQAVATIRFPANSGYSVGDTLNLTLPTGNTQPQPIRLTAQHLNNGLSIPFTPVAEGEMNTVTAVVTDPQGNRSMQGSASARTDLRMPGDSNNDTNLTATDAHNGAPEVEISTGKGGRITSPNLNNGQAVATIKLPASNGYSVGDTLEVTLPQGNNPQPIRLTAQHLTDGVRIPFTPVAEGEMNAITAVVTDPQGNRSAQGFDEAMTDLRMPGDSDRNANANNADANRGAPLVSIATGNDNAIQQTDLNNGKARVTITLPEANGYSVGDDLVVTLPNSTTQSVKLTAQHLRNGYTAEFTPNAHGQVNTVTAVVTDPQGNRSQTGSARANSDFPPPDPSTLTEIDMLIPTNDIVLRNISVRFAGVQEHSNSGRDIEELDNQAKLRWGGQNGSFIKISAGREVNAKELNTFFQVANLEHSNSPVSSNGYDILKQTGLVLSFELEINGQRTQVRELNFGDVFLLETGTGISDDFFAFKSTAQTINVGGSRYTIKLENSAANAQLHTQNRDLMIEAVQTHLRSQAHQRFVPTGFTRLNPQQQNELIYIRSPEREHSNFSLGFAVTSTDPNAAKPAVLPSTQRGKVDDSTNAWQSLNGTLTVTETTSGRFELKKGNDLFGVFTGNRNGEFQFSPQSAMLLNIDNREELSASFRKGKHTVTLNLKGSYSTDVAKLAESDKTDVIYKITEGSVVDYNKVDSRVEMIDLSRSNVTVQNLTLANVKAHNDSGLYIKGDGRDIIHLGTVAESGSATQQDQSGEWRKGAVHRSSLDSDTPLSYDTWTHTDNTVLYIQQGIQVL